jgi:hypothetical protein
MGTQNVNIIKLIFGLAAFFGALILAMMSTIPWVLAGVICAAAVTALM